MNTSLATRRPLLRRHTEIIGAVLVAALLAIAHWYSGPLLYVFFAEYDGFTGVEPRAGLIPYLLAMAVLVFVALTSASAVARCVSWILFMAAWISAFFTFWGYEWDGVYTTRLETVVATLMWFWVAAPPVAFLLVCWRLPRPRFDTYLAESVLLPLIAIYLYNYFSAYEIEGVPLEPILVSVGVAAYFGFAAWLVPTRRIVYGSIALAAIAIAACAARLFTLDTGNYADGEFTPQNLLDLLLIGIPAIGLVAQIVWHQRSKARGEAPVDATPAE
jgi:hypothetical protein